MKKTTIRIAGFLLAAACVALLASCKNNTSPATNNASGKKDEKKPAPYTYGTGSQAGSIKGQPLEN